jgi:hypothetical protein
VAEAGVRGAEVAEKEKEAETWLREASVVGWGLAGGPEWVD